MVSVPGSFAQDYTQWDLPEGAKARLGKGKISEITYSPEGVLLAVASGIGIWLYDVETSQEVALLTEHTKGALSVSFSPDGQTLASGSWQEVCLWDVETGRLKSTLTGHTRGVLSVSFSVDGSTLATGSVDSTVLLWDLASTLPEPPRLVVK